MMVTTLLFLNFALMILLPILLGWIIHHRRYISWRFFGIGLAGFVVSQLFHIPFNLLVQKTGVLPAETEPLTNLLIWSVFLGLSAGVFEEVTRYFFLKYWATTARTWGRGLMFGAGWGGIEAILLGSLGLLNFVILLGMNNGYFWGLVPVEQVDLASRQVTAFFNVPAQVALLGAVERLIALTLHLSLSLMVMQVFLRKNMMWLGAAVLWHALLDATAVFAVSYLGTITTATNAALGTEAIIALFGLLSLLIIWRLKTPEPVEPEIVPLPPVGPSRPAKVEVTEELLDRSKYS